ncbi:intracellular protein transport protein USO1 isoform X6 [Cryptotermes secundus]|nr:intracellular protein transport protein USO1 isoform X6 [Cryptotermes secundus]
MADVAKTVKVVSNSSACGVSLCELTSNNIEADSLDIHNRSSSNPDSTDLTLNLPSPDEETSLQELIESELALRKELIESQFSPRFSSYADTVGEVDGTDAIGVKQIDSSPVKSSPTILFAENCDEADYEALDVNTQFILAERNHSFQTFTGNDMFFFNTLDDTQMNGIDPCLKDEQDLADPFLEEEPNIVESEIESTQEPNEIETCSISYPEAVDECLHESSESDCVTDSSVLKDGIDQITLSTFDPFTTIVDSSKSEPIDNPDIVETPSSECADSDFICIQADISNDDLINGTGSKSVGGVHPSQNLDESLGACDYVETMPEEVLLDEGIPTNDVVSVNVSNSMEEFECGSNGLLQSVGRVVTNVFDTVDIDDDEIPVTPEEATSKVMEESVNYKVIIPEIDIIPPDDNEISESELVSNEELSIASDGHGPEVELTNGLAEDEFANWTTVAEALETEEETRQISEIPEDLGPADTDVHVHADDIVPEVCSPKNTDSSYSDSEKSEFVMTKTAEKKTKKKKSEGEDTIKIKKTKKTKKSDPEKENISVANSGLTHVGSVTNNEVEMSPKECIHADGKIMDDDLSSVSVKVLKSTYANQNHAWPSKEMMKEIDEDIQLCGPIQSLKQTYCNQAQKTYRKQDNPEKKEVIETGISIKELRRSFGDLSTLCDEEDAERANYCNLVNLPAESKQQQKSSFSKFDQLSKKTVLHVRSVDAAKVQKQFNQTAESAPEQTSNCKSCGKQVFQMEQVKAERAVWHKNCFRCKECNKQLTVDIYSSHEGQVYCKPHFRELFKPKAVVDEDAELPRLRKPELIIRENQPIELPPEVVRASDKPDLGLEELSTLNVKSRYQVFEKSETTGGSELERSPSSVGVKRSPSILSKLARFQAKGMDIGVTDDSLNGIPYEESSTSSDEEEEVEGEEGEADRELIRSNRKQRERPVSFSKMEDIKCRWESGQAAWREEQRQERKQEIQNIRSRLFLGKQGKMKEMYEQAVKDSENMTTKKEVGVRSEKAKSIKEKFERGEVLPDDDAAEEDDRSKKGMEEDMSVFEAGISKKSRSLFLELDATAVKTQQQQQQQQPLLSPLKSPLTKDDPRRRLRETVLLRQPSEDVVRSSDFIEDVKVETAEVSNKFKFFETYKAPEKERKQFRITPPREGQVKVSSPDREIYRDPDIVRSEDKLEDDEVMKTNTAKKMLSIFRQLEENASKEDIPDGPKPLKRFTPPPDYRRDSGSSEEETESEEEDEDEEEEEEEGDVNPNIVRSSDKIEDEFLKQAQNAARAKALRAKFERWEEKENRANANAATNASHAVGNLNGSLELDQSSEHTSIDTTKSLRARFESLKNESQQPKERIPRPKVNRFVEIQTTCAEFCSFCEKKVYPLEKVETGGKLLHKQCFRCLQCNCILRMETYTLNNGKLYCIPHFKQLFIAKGNYEEGFGLDQHKRKWSNRNNSEDDLLNSLNSSPEN